MTPKLVECLANRVPTSVRRGDRRAWASARALDDLGELTARWLEGDLWSQPGDQPNCGPDEETRELIPTLAVANRAGFVTAGSQPGIDTPGLGVGGGQVRQRAAVYGFIDGKPAADALWEAARRARLWTVAARRYPCMTTVPVTTVNGTVLTSFGARLHQRDIRSIYEHLCSDEAVEALCRAFQVTLIDPDWGRDDRLWPVLREFAAEVAA